MTWPAYLELSQSGELRRRVDRGYQILEDCILCGNDCHANRRHGEYGKCFSGEIATVSSFGPHLGEEDPLRGWRGSGTVFFGRCNLHCQYCQNSDISQIDTGDPLEPAQIAGIFLELQQNGGHNINLVSPTHVVPQILAAVYIAAQAGLNLPLVYNTGGYDSLETLALLDGIIDIYMPDMKYSQAEEGVRLSKIFNYPEVNQLAVKEMYRQVGNLVISSVGLARRGLLVRHLVLPADLAGTPKIVNFLANEISPETYLNLMDQYRPAFRANQYPELMRRITNLEWEVAVQSAQSAGLHRLDHLSKRY